MYSNVIGLYWNESIKVKSGSGIYKLIFVGLILASFEILENLNSYEKFTL